MKGKFAVLVASLLILMNYVLVTSTSAGDWVDYTDGSYWQCLGSCSNWDGSEWVEAGPGMSLQTEAESTWADGFRPTKVRVTFTASLEQSVLGSWRGATIMEVVKLHLEQNWISLSPMISKELIYI